MNDIAVAVPTWMNWVSLPVLVIALLILDYCAAIWLKPAHIPSLKGNADATTRDIFAFLVIFSLIGAFFGTISSLTDVSFGRALLVEFVFLAFFLWALLPKKLWFVAAVCYESAFFVSEALIQYNAVLAGLLAICIIAIILVIAITIGPLSLMKTK